MIELKNVTKTYGLTKALTDVSFKIEKGEIIGFVGPNGAGKSTAMKIITTYTAPTSGTAIVGGYDVLENPYEVRKIIGYLPETVPLYYDMMVYDYLEFVGEARHLNGKLKSRLGWVVESCHLESVLNRQIGVLSKGFKQRVCLAQALIHDPDILILDEPTSGLDPLQIIGIRNLIKNLAHEKTIMVSTHILQEVASIADRILVINEGRIVAVDTYDALRAKIGADKIIYLDVNVDKATLKSSLNAIKGIEQLEFLSATDHSQTRVRIHYHSESVPSELDQMIKTQNWPLNEFHKEGLSLEETFIRLISQGKEVQEKAVEGGNA
ncbi:ATP-binding cassette domain-containing protein [candidate division KSB1 bacterium]|nr:ATP-binding cassette domain-containing protein [candidate division KSB1 bacterium]